MILAQIWKSHKNIPFFSVFGAHATDLYGNMKANGSILTQMEGDALAAGRHEASTHTNEETQMQTLTRGSNLIFQVRMPDEWS